LRYAKKLIYWSVYIDTQYILLHVLSRRRYYHKTKADTFGDALHASEL